MRTTSSEERKAIAVTLRGAFAEWSGWGLRRHLAAVAVLLLVVLVRWWGMLSVSVPINDEMIYTGAFRQVAEGGSPYSQGGYLYPAVAAVVGGWVVRCCGPGVALAVLRALNCLGLVVAVWCSLAWLPGRPGRRLALGCLISSLAPPVRFAMVCGNISPLVAGLAIAGLTLWPERPLRGGALLGASVAVKPLAPAAILLLLAHRALGGPRRKLLAAVAAGGVAGALLFGFPYSREMLAAVDLGRVARSASLHRVPYLLGLRGAVGWVSLVALLIGVTVVRRWSLGRGQLMAVAVTTSLAATPLVWSHTLLLALPIEVMALIAVRGRWRGARRHRDLSNPAGRRIVFEMIFVVLGVLAIQFAEGITGIDDRAVSLQLLGLVPTALAPVFLTAYLIAVGESF